MQCLMNDELGRMWKEAVVAYLNILRSHWAGRTKENKIRQSLKDSVQGNTGIPHVPYCDTSTRCWFMRRWNEGMQPASKRQLGKRDFRAGAITSHFRSKGMSRVFTWLPGDEPPSCQTATGVGDVT
jgi:hypothetical protein